ENITDLDLPVGNYTVNLTTVVDGNHTPATNTSTITVNPAPSVVEGENVTVTYGEPIVVPYESTNATNVTYEIYDGDELVVNGTVGPDGTIDVEQLPVGNYTVNWTTIVDGNHTPATNTSTITVNPAPSLVEGENVTVYYGQLIFVPYESTNATDVTYEIFDSEGKSIVNGTVGPDGYIPVGQLPVGNYTVNWNTIVDENHIPATNVSTIEVLPIPTTVTIGNVTAYPGENVTIPINVTIINGVPFNGNVSAVMPDNTTQVVPVVNGTGKIIWYVPDDYTPDKYPDVIKFPGTDTYGPSNGTGIVEVVKIPTHISVGNVTTFAGMEVTIPINVTADDGKPFSGNVTITLPDGSNKTVEIINGTGTTTWFVPYDYTPDKYPDTVRFAGDNKYLPSEGNGTITVIKIPVDIIVGNVTGRPGDEVTIPIKVIPRDGSVFNGDVTVELPDGTVKVIKIVNGKGSVDWTIPEDYKAGKYPVKVYSNETNIYYAANGTGYVAVIVDDVPPTDDENETHSDVAKKAVPKEGLAKYETGNPIVALLMVLALLGVSIKRRK
ncbi:PKD domain-containing protein, partial [Methanobrevibacter sp.]